MPLLRLFDLRVEPDLPGTPFAIPPLRSTDSSRWEPAMRTAPLPAEDLYDRPWFVATVAVAGDDRAPARARVGEWHAVPGYEVLGGVGGGGMATVYKSRQLRPRRLMAVKVIDADLAR